MKQIILVLFSKWTTINMLLPHPVLYMYNIWKPYKIIYHLGILSICNKSMKTCLEMTNIKLLEATEALTNGRNCWDDVFSCRDVNNCHRSGQAEPVIKVDPTIKMSFLVWGDSLILCQEVTAVGNQDIDWGILKAVFLPLLFKKIIFMVTNLKNSANTIFKN